MRRYLLDTNAVSDFLNRREKEIQAFVYRAVARKYNSYIV